MKLRCKAKNSSISYNLSVDDDCMLGELYVRLQNYTDLCTWTWSLSLNGKDSLEGNEDKALKDFGIVSGDLLWLIPSSSSTPASKVPKHDGNVATGQSNIPMATDGMAVVMESATPIHQEPGPPPRCDELLRVLFAVNKPCSLLDSVVVLAHSQLVSAGFQHSAGGRCLPSGGSVCTPPASSAYRTDYSYACEQEAVQCHLVCIPMGRVCVFHANVVGSKSVWTCQVAPGTYVNPMASFSQGADKIFLTKALHFQLKEKLVLPLMNEARAALGLSEVYSFNSLPLEVKFLILSFLDVVSVVRMLCTSKELSRLATDSYVWYSLYKKDFGLSDHSLSPWSVNWKEIYRQKYIEHKMSSRNIESILPAATHHLPYSHPDPRGGGSPWLGLLQVDYSNPLRYFFGLS
jgi:hypothetical protein